jgi:hypothetical protein
MRLRSFVITLLASCAMLALVPVEAHAIPDGWFKRTVVANDAAVDDGLGEAIDISGERMIVGAPSVDDELGRAYVYRREGLDWVQEAELAGSDVAANDFFGSAVAIEDDLALVGARFHDEPENTGGAAYVFQRAGTTWSQVQKLTSPDVTNAGRFGSAVAMDRPYVIIGAPGEDGGGGGRGAVHFYTVNDSPPPVLVHEDTVTPPDVADFDFFGSSVAIQDDAAIVGAPHADPAGSSSGRAYILERTGGTWTPLPPLAPATPAANRRFGTSVGIGEGHAIVGHHGLMNIDDEVTTNGSAVFFSRDGGGTWVRGAEVSAASPIWDFGSTVAMDDDMAAIGGPSASSDGGGETGTVHTYARSGTGWNRIAVFNHDTTGGLEERELFGTSVSIDSDTIAVGRPSSGLAADDGGAASTFTRDRDRDGTRDALDNCPSVYARIQQDTDDDGLGDPCDPPESPRPDLMLKKASVTGRFVGENIYGAAAPDQLVHATHPTGGRRIFRLRIENDGLEPGEIRLTQGTSDGASFRILTAAGTEVPWSGPRIYDLDPGESRTLRIVVRIASSAPAGDERGVRFHATGGGLEDHTTALTAGTSG